MCYTFTVVPYRIAFPSNDTEFWRTFDLIIDSLFLLDVLVNSFTAFYINDDEIETSNKKIIIHYAKTWMIFDVLASIPFQEIFTGANWNSVIKVGRLPRLYRLVKIAKILRVLKTQRSFQAFSNHLGFIFKIPLTLKRLAYFLVTFFLICHLLACLWYFVSTIDIQHNQNWVTKYDIQDKPESDLYIASFYWTVTTLTTVGYGDITPANNLERGICICVMLGGVFFYSYTISTITSIMSESDKRKTKLEGKFLILQDICKNFSINKKLVKKIKSAIEYDQSRYNKERDEMIASLPKKMALQLNLMMNKRLVEKNKFFENRPIPFIHLILTHLRPYKFKSKENVFYKGEYSNEMYFVTTGEVIIYDTQNNVDIRFGVAADGDYYGDIGVILSEPHEFSAKVSKDTELMALSRDDLFTKVLCLFDEQLKSDLILKTTLRRDMFRENRKNAFNEYNMNKLLVRSVTKERKVSDPAETDIFRVKSEKNAKRINKIRNTLSRKTISMLEFTNGNDLERIKREIEGLKLAVLNLKDRVAEENKKKFFNRGSIESLYESDRHKDEKSQELENNGNDELFIKINRSKKLTKEKHDAEEQKSMELNIVKALSDNESISNIGVQNNPVQDPNHLINNKIPNDTISKLGNFANEQDLFLSPSKTPSGRRFTANEKVFASDELFETDLKNNSELHLQAKENYDITDLLLNLPSGKSHESNSNDPGNAKKDPKLKISLSLENSI